MFTSCAIKVSVLQSKFEACIWFKDYQFFAGKIIDRLKTQKNGAIIR